MRCCADLLCVRTRAGTMCNCSRCIIRASLRPLRNGVSSRNLLPLRVCARVCVCARWYLRITRRKGATSQSGIRNVRTTPSGQSLMRFAILLSEQPNRTVIRVHVYLIATQVACRTFDAHSRERVCTRLFVPPLCVYTHEHCTNARARHMDGGAVQRIKESRTKSHTHTHTHTHTLGANDCAPLRTIHK